VVSSRIEDARVVQDQMVTARRHLHRHPEVGLDLPDTHTFLLQELEDLGLDVESHAAAGLTVRIPGHAPDGTTSVLRADMDALPVQEASGVPYASERDGAMHACGHDLHMAMLLGAARVLAEKPPARDVVLAFQPGEETDRGALRTLEHRSLSDLTDATAFAIHVNAVQAPHSVNYRRDTFMAFGDWFRVDYRGEGGHASQPASTGNPIEAASWLVQDLRDLVERLSADEHLVATVTECLMGNTVNVIPAHGRLRGTLRTLSPAQRDRLVDGLRDITARSAALARVSGTFELHEGYPAVVSDPGFVDGMVRTLRGAGLGHRLHELERPSMVIEDFSYFLHRWPGTMVYLGANVPGHTSFNHSADVVFDEDVLATGAALLLLAADGFRD
jgi:amidohydrolase